MLIDRSSNPFGFPFSNNELISAAVGIGKAVDLVDHILESDQSDILRKPLVRAPKDILDLASYWYIGLLHRGYVYTVPVSVEGGTGAFSYVIIYAFVR